MKKSALVTLLVLTLTMTMLSISVVSANNITAKSNQAKVVVNGKTIDFDAYTIENSTYFKIRDLAYVLNGDAKGFEIVWDEQQNAIFLYVGNDYTKVGTEMAKGSGTNSTCQVNTSPVYFNGNLAEMKSYMISGSSYFKLADVMKLVNADVSWNEATSTIGINTNKPYAVADIVSSGKEKSIQDLANKLVGKAYVYGGTDPKTGFDCSGVSYYVMQQNGITIPRTSAAQLDGSKGTKLKVGETVRVGDIVKAPVFWMTGEISAAPLHGIYIGNGQVVGSAEGIGVYIQQNVTQVTEAVRYTKETEITQDVGLKVVDKITDPNAIVVN